jgi:hypothetical protein
MRTLELQKSDEMKTVDYDKVPYAEDEIYQISTGFGCSFRLMHGSGLEFEIQLLAAFSVIVVQ